MEQINRTKIQPSAREEEPSGGLGQSRASLEATKAFFVSHGGTDNPRILRHPQDEPPASDSRVGDQQRSQCSSGEHEELVWSGEDSSDDEVTPTMEDMPQLSIEQTNPTELEIPRTSINTKLTEVERRVQLSPDLPSTLNTPTVQQQLEELEVLRVDIEQSCDPSTEGQRPRDTDLRCRQRKVIEEVTAAKRRRESQPLQIEGYRSKLCAAKCLLDTLMAKQENAEKGAVESSIAHLEKVRSLAGDVEKEKMVLVELGELGDKVSEHLNEMDRVLLRRQLGCLGRDWLRLEGSLQRNLWALTAEVEDYHRHLTQLRELASWAESQGSGQPQEEGPRPDLTSDLEGRWAALCWCQREAERSAQTMRGTREKEQLVESLRRAQSTLTAMPRAFPESGGSGNVRLLEEALTRLKKTGGRLAVGAEKIALLPEDLRAQVEDHQAMHADIARQLPAIEALSAQADETDSLLTALRDTGAELERESASRLRHLTAALPGREAMAAREAELGRWLEKVEGAVGSGVSRRVSDSHLEEQLALLREILHQLPGQQELLASVLREAREVFPALTNSERSFLSSRLKFLERKFSASTALVRNHTRRAEEELSDRREFASLADAFQWEAEEIRRLLPETVAGGELTVRVGGLQAGFQRLWEWSDACCGAGQGRERLDGLRALLAEIEGQAHEELECLAEAPEAAEQPRRLATSGKAEWDDFNEDPCNREERYPEKQREYVTDCRQLSDLLDTLETALRHSAAQIPTSYKAAIEQVERQAALGGEIDSIERRMTDLWDRAVDLERSGGAGGGASASRAVTRLWDHWLCLQDSAREQELHCRDLREEWKTISEQIDRATIVLDHLQDDLPDGPREQATKAELLDLEDYVIRYDDDLRHQQSALAVLVWRVTNVLGVQDASDPTPATPVLQELRAMEDRCRSLAQKIGNSRRGIEEEVREREKTLQEINGIRDWLQQAATQLESTGLDSDGRPEERLEGLRGAVSARRQAMAEVSGRMQNRYSERYTTIPAEISTRIQETSRVLGDMEEKVRALGSQNTRSQQLSCRIAAIRSGLQNVEKMLQQRSKTDSEAKAQQKRIWHEIDEWHSVLSQLDAEVLDLAEQDPEHAQELMESLLGPFQQHQQVSRSAEQRTTLLNKIPACLEEYKQITNSAVSWMQSTEALLSSETDYTSAKLLSKQLLAFQMATESGRQKQHGLQDIACRLKELSVMYEIDELIQRVSELGDGGSALQQTIAQKLPEMEHIATEIGDIESEVKNIESKVSKIKAILSSVDVRELPVQEHLENRQIIWENLEEMKALVGVMEECKESLGLTEEVVRTVEVFTKVARVSVELTHLQELTTQQSIMLQSLLEKLQEYATEIVRLQKEDEFSSEGQGERLAGLTERRELLLNNTQEALAELVQEELACEQPVDEGCTEEEQSSSAHTDQPGDSQVKQRIVFPDGKLSSLMEENEDIDEDEDTVESAERSRTPVPVLDACPSSLEDLHVCRERAAVLEHWLETAGETLGVSGRDQEMQRDMEEQLLQSQEAHAKEITQTDGTFYLQLPTGQPILPATKPRLTRQDSLQQQKELEVELTEHKHLTEYIALHAERMWHQNQQSPDGEEQDSTHYSSRDSGDPLPLGDAMPTDPRAPGEVPATSDQVAANWRHLQRETEGCLRLLEDSLRQGLGSQVTVTAGNLRSVQGISSAPPPAAEELNSWVTQLGELGREAAAIATQGEGDINEDACLKLEEGMQNTALRISHWLDAAEEGMCSYSLIPIEEAEQQLQHHQLQAEALERVCRELSEQRRLLEQSEVLRAQARPLALDCLASLQSRLKVLQSARSTMDESLRAGTRQITGYQVRLRQLEAALLERRTDVQQRLVESVGHSTDEQLQLVEEMECELEPFEEQVLAVIAEGERRNLEPAATQDFDKLEEVLNSTRVCLRERRREVRHSLVVGNRYECLVQGLADLVECGQEKVAQEARLLTKSAGDLQSHLQNYKLFFRRLANHLMQVEQVSRNVPESIVAHNRDVCLEMFKEGTALQSWALLHGVQMETALQAWTEFEVDHSFLMKEMEMLSSAVPSVGLVEETEDRLTERIGTFQRIGSSLREKQPRLDQALRNGKALLTTVSSPELEGRLSTLEEDWLSLKNRVNHELHRLEMLLEHWTRFQRESHEVGQWLESAKSSLRYWEQESVSLPPKPETSGNQLSLFLEFWKEVDGRCSSKTSVISMGNQLLGLQQADGSALRARLTQLEQEWAQLVARLPSIQEKLHQLQMERLPSRQAITELSAWISGVDTSMWEDEAVTLALGSSAGLKLMLQKYKDYKMEMSCRQLTVDCVNQSLLQISSQDVVSDRYEKMDFAESLGTLNFQWERLTRDVNRKMLHLESLLESWTEYERRVQSLDSWFEAQGERLRKNMKACSHTSVLSALTDCQEFSERLKVKEMELERLRQTVPLATESSAPETPMSVKEKLDQLHDWWRSLDAEASQLYSTLTSQLQLWTTYQNSYEQVNGNILRARYSLEHCTPLSSSLEAVRVQVETLQGLQDTMECGEESWRNFLEASQRLREECCPPLTLQLKKKCEDTHSRWTCVNQDITEQLRSAHTVSLLWQRFHDVYRSTLAKVQQSEEGYGHLLEEISVEDGSQESLQSRLVETQESLCDLRTLQEDISRVCEAADELARRIDSSSSVALQSDSRYLSGKVSHLEGLLSLKIPDIRGSMEQYEHFRRCLHTLETLVNESEEVLKSDDSSTEGVEQARMEAVKDHLLKLSGASLRLETLKHLSYRLPLSDPDYRRVQDLNRRWEQARATALDRCSELQKVMLQEESFGQKCERWRQFLEKVEEGLAVDVAGSYEGLKEQQETHELFQAEVSIAQQILDSVVSEALNLMPRGEVQDSTFALNLSALKERWHGLVRRVRQRQDTVCALANQWRCYDDSAAKLHKLLTGTSNQLRVMDDLSCYRLRQLWRLVEDVKYQERNLGRHKSRYALTLEAGRELLLAADAQTQASLGGQLCQLQEAWESANSQLKDKRIELTNMEKTCDRCGEEVTALGVKLREFRADVKRALPRSSEDLQREQSKLQGLGGPLRHWSNSLAELSSVKADLGKHLVPDAAVGFQEQIAHLESQWGHLRLTVSLRTLEISDRLEQWIVFNTKSKRLGDWLKQMEDRVSQNTERGIEEMIERLQKDCTGEIKLCNKNKVQLQQLGDELIKASSTSKAAEIDNKLHLINSHWQHLFEVIEARVKRLKDTLCSVQHLDRGMSNLRTWLSHIESQLSKPVVYNICDDQEIEKKLAEQQELQRDIEEHSVGVTSVLSLCDSLLLDTDTETECDSIQQTTRSLDRRWRNICAMSVERRMKIEETWRLWQKFLDDYSRFEDWLKGAERTAAQPNSSQVLYTLAKEELKKFETFQRQIHESLTQLELINKQYRRLARENRTDCSSRLKQMVHEGNQRWDSLQKRITAILRRLKHFTNQREEFESSRDGILVWLTEMDLQLTNVEHFSESDIDDKVRQLNAFQQEITLNTNKIDQLIVSGELLIQKIEPMDATVIEDELEELHAYCQEVFGRVARFHQRLMSKRPVFDEDKDLSDREADTEDGSELQNESWQEKAGGSELSAQESLDHLTPPGATQQHERSGRETPVSVDSIPLEWDHTVDVGGSSSHEDEEDSLYFNTLSGDSGPDPVSWRPATTPEGSRKCQFQQTEITIAHRPSASGQGSDTAHREGYVRVEVG